MRVVWLKCLGGVFVISIFWRCTASATYVVGWGYNSASAQGIILADFNDVAEITAGSSINLGLGNDGSLIGRSVYGNSLGRFYRIRRW
jgi:hypothetical protein